jgi:hypothetical protein
MLRALVDGERDPEVLAELSKGVLRKKIPAHREALRGRFRDHHALLIRLCLDRTAHLEAAIAELDAQVDQVWTLPLRPATTSTPSPGSAGGRRAAGGGVHHRRDRGGHDPVPDRWAPVVVGRHGTG